MGLGTLLGAIAVGLLVAVAVVQALLGNALPDRAVTLLERILLILMMIELLYAVQVSFREHTLAPEPFLIVGLIAAIRRLLVLTAEFAGLLEKNKGGVPGGDARAGTAEGDHRGPCCLAGHPEEPPSSRCCRAGLRGGQTARE